MNRKRKKKWKIFLSSILIAGVIVTALPLNGIAGSLVSASGEDSSDDDIEEMEAGNTEEIEEPELETGLEEELDPEQADEEIESDSVDSFQSADEELEPEESMEEESEPYNIGQTVAIDFGDDAAVAAGTGYTVANDVVTLTGNYDYVLTGTTTRCSIVVSSSTRQVTLKDLSVSVQAKSPITITEGGDLTVVLEGENVLHSVGVLGQTQSSVACIYLTGSTDLLITGEQEAVLTCSNSGQGAYVSGIAAFDGFSGELILERSNIVIDVNNTGIGCQSGDLDGTIRITESTVNGIRATVGVGALAGLSSSGSIIIEEGSEITGSNSFGMRAAVGTGGEFEGTISIQDSQIRGGSSSGTMIGGGSTTVQRGGIIIERSHIELTKWGPGACGIGAKLIETDGYIRVSDHSIIIATRSSGGGPGIGSIRELKGNIYIESSQVDIDLYGGSNGAGIGSGGTSGVSSSGKIIIEDSTVKAVPGYGGVGIGSGGASANSTTGMKGAIRITRSQIFTGVGDGSIVGATGIGCGNYEEFSGALVIEDNSTVNIQSAGNGAGIGTGFDGKVTGKILIDDSTVDVISAGAGSGIGAGGFRAEVNGMELVIQNNAHVTVTGGSEGADGIGRGAQSTLSDLKVSLDESSQLYAFSRGEEWSPENKYYAINATEVSGDGQFINAHLTDGRKGPQEIDIYLTETLMEQLPDQPWKVLQLPDGYSSFAYTVGSEEGNYVFMQMEEDNEKVSIVNGDYENQNDPAGYGPHQVSYQYGIFQPASTSVKWPVMLQEIFYDAELSYYYFDQEGNEQEWVGAGYTELVKRGNSFTIDTGSARIPENYATWYYMVDGDDTKYYFEDQGAQITVYSDMNIRVYAASTVISVTMPDQERAGIWYVNEESITAGGSFEIRSGTYRVENHGEMGLKVSVVSYEETGMMREISELLNHNSEDELVLNLTGDLKEGKLGQDLLQTGTESDPFGTYSSILEPGGLFRFGLDGYYRPASGSLPSVSAASNYRLNFTFEIDLSGR